MEKIFKYIVYKTTNTVNNKIYIGVHKTTDPNVFDGYLGCDVWCNRPSSYSNPKTAFQHAVKKHGPENFIRETLQIFNTLDEAFNLEAQLVNNEYIKSNNNYNMVIGGKYRSPSNCKPVFLYTREGTFVKKCISYTEASLFIFNNINNIGNITRAVNKGFCCGDYQLRNIYKESIQPYPSDLDKKRSNLHKFTNYVGVESNFSKSRVVARCDKNGNILETYMSVNQARKQGYWNALNVLTGKRKTCKGFIFKYLD